MFFKEMIMGWYWDIDGELPSLVLTNPLLLEIAIYTEKCPLDSMVILHSYVSLPEGASEGISDRKKILTRS